ncbi:tRNA (adenine(58)-N(1))-methyltransferase, mitochondrial [Pleurodeles waltl]|uniref:tRNA (adenine(58)-N(1))-methyltransferase, mitochondrial n=1 Tax=Pleurodeles waltl TaxID=8319 RepID=UPI0037099635
MLQCGRKLFTPAPCRALLLHRAAGGLPEGSEWVSPLQALCRLAAAFYSASSQSGGGGDGGAGDGCASGQPPSDSSPSPALQRSRLRRRRGSLSPLERLSQLIPAEMLSEEVTDLRAAGHLEHTSVDSQRLPAAPEHTGAQAPPAGTQPPVHERRVWPGSISQDLNAGVQTRMDETLRTNSIAQPFQVGPGVSTEPPTDEEHLDYPPLVGQGSDFKVGDLCLAEYHRKYYLEFKKMFALTETNKLLSNWGMVHHKDITGKQPGQMLKSSTGFPLLFRRPTLEEFVLFMKRGPTISYPKDSHAMLSLMDVNPGDTILEAGSGSGGMSLFLSKAAGSEGRVLSFEVRSDHHRVAKKNYQRWRDAWQIGHGHQWPDNVEFINKDLCAAEEDIKSITFDAVSLDMLHPQCVLPLVFPNLKPGGVCAAYVANITQVIDLLEGIRVCQLSLFCEKITEVIHKDWLVVPSRQKDGSITQRMDPKLHSEALSQDPTPTDDQDSDTEESLPEDVAPFGSVPYIARPFPWQTGHTAFLVKLRKFIPASKNLA